MENIITGIRPFTWKDSSLAIEIRPFTWELWIGFHYGVTILFGPLQIRLEFPTAANFKAKKLDD